jgi:prepilin-type N-terminal cleavage/methylation domain-containing protein
LILSRARSTGFTLTELAVVLTIVAFLLASLMYTLSAQSDQRNFEESRHRLEQARDLVLAFAVVNGRLPCPARSAATAAPATQIGDEVRTTGAGDPDCIGDAVTDYYGGTNAGVTLGLLPARAIGFQQVNSAGLAIDAWANPIRYAVAHLATGCATGPTYPHWTNTANLKANGISCQPNDLLICKSASGINATTCGGAANQIMSTSLVVAVIYSTGKNGGTPTGGTGADEAANLNGDRVYVFHEPTPSDFVNGEFDDQMVWITSGEFYGKLIAAGQLP